MEKKRIKILPDRIFHKLWTSVSEFDTRDDYINQYMSVLSEDYINFSDKYRIKIPDIYRMLSSIYTCANMSFKEIIDKVGLKKKDISHIYCIPIRTVEDWYYGKNRCPSYVILMLLRDYELLNLGNYIKLESEEDKESRKTSIYKHSEAYYSKQRMQQEMTSDINSDDEYEVDEEFKLFLDSIDMGYSKQEAQNIKDSVKTRRLLEDTSYLGEILNSRKVQNKGT